MKNSGQAALQGYGALGPFAVGEGLAEASAEGLGLGLGHSPDSSRLSRLVALAESRALALLASSGPMSMRFTSSEDKSGNGGGQGRVARVAAVCTQRTLRVAYTRPAGGTRTHPSWPSLPLLPSRSPPRSCSPCRRPHRHPWLSRQLAFDCHLGEGGREA